MNIQNLLTAQAAQSGNKAGTTQAAGSPVLQGGLSFVDLIWARILQSQQPAGQDGLQQTQAHNVLQSENPLLTKQPKLDIAQLLSATRQTEEQVKAFQLDTQNEIAAALTLNQKAFGNILKPVIAEDGTQTTQGLTHGIKLAIAKIDRVLNGQSPQNPLLKNFTPDQLKQIKQTLSDILAQLEGSASNVDPLKEKLKEIFAALGMPGLIPTETNPTTITAVAAQLNKIAVGEEKKSLAQPFTPISIAAGELEIEEGGIGKFMKPLIGKKGGDISNIGQGKPQSAPQNTQTQMSAFPAGMFPFESFLTGSLSWTQNYGDDFGLQTSGASLTNLASLASPVTQAHAASLPHPATQIVAATLHRAAAGGENKTLMLQLDPPELGRVEVRMEFSKDKSVKAIVTSEKAETHMMLQRDAHVLERALENAGIDLGNSSLDFSLAEHDHNFGRNNYRSGGQDSARNDAEDEIIIEASMNWHVDPETGHMRYNIYA